MLLGDGSVRHTSMSLHLMTNFNVFFFVTTARINIHKMHFVLRTLYFSKLRIKSFHEIEVFVQSKVLIKDMATVYSLIVN